ncbi:MAG TPA: efflux transporter outer membrane subunit [Steroidobacter sp.]|nr:efflux transporter outer membrane subunit [Steroidobacter sp.]
MRASYLTALACVAVAAAPGCAMGPSFTPREMRAPDQWSAAALDEAGEIVQSDPAPQWWTLFGDPLLTELVELTHERNLDLRAAALRVAQSRAQRDAVAGRRGPDVSGNASWQRQRQSEFGVGTRLIDAIGAPGAERDAVIDVLSQPHDVYQAGFDASWELDLWGRVRRMLESADASAAASAAELQFVQLSIAAETARTYIELRGVQDQLRIARRDVEASEGLLELTQLRADGGLVTQLDVVSQRARLADARARIPQIEQLATQLIDNLGLLCGEPPGALRERLAGARPIPTPPPQVAVGVPSQAARRRPDIRAAEARLQAATAEIGVAAADLYPRITLTGGFLAQSLESADLGEWGARQWAVGPSLYLPLFDGGRRRAVLELRELQQQEAAVNYQHTVLRAWREIDNALSAYRAEQRRLEDLQAAVAASQEAYEIAAMRYEHGLVSFLVALDAQRTLLQAQRAHSDSTTAVATHLVALYKALGGAW